MANIAAHTESKSPTFGALLQHYRQQAGLTQEGLAERAGISVRGLSDLERGVNATPRRDTLGLLLDALALAPQQRDVLLQAARRPATQSSAVALSAGRLPILGESLIGREADLAAVAALVGDPAVRLVTLVGPGGIGKTRLAIATGQERLADGAAVTWVPLAAARSASAALASVVAALGLEDRGTVPVPILLAQAVQRRDHLLILDNLEQIPDLAPEIVQLLAVAPGITVLATSRAPLRLRGERRYQVPPLSLDNSPHAGNPSPAVELFARRAIEIDHRFALSPDNTATVQAICDRLDGLPLAIELAAARSGLLPPSALLERLERALPLLTTGPQDAPDRQRTLRDAIAWSYDLLPAQVQRVLRQVSVCVGGFTLQTAEALCQTAPPDVLLDQVHQLVEQSLLRAVTGTSPLRFMMLETVREFAREHLEQSGEVKEASLQHARWFAAHTLELHAMLPGPDALAGLRSLDAELPNIRLAMSTLLAEPAMIVEASGLATNLSFYAYLRGLHSESLRWFTQVLEHRESLPTRQVSHVLLAASAALNVRGDLAGEALAREARDLQTTLAGDPDFDPGDLGEACLYLADCIENPVLRREILEVGLFHASRGSQRVGEAFLRAMHGMTCAELGDFAPALVSGEQALAIQQDVGGPIGIGHAAGHLGQSLRMQGRFPEAEVHLLTAFRCFWATGALGWTAGAMEGLADCAAHNAQHERAAWLYGAASQLRMRSSWETDLLLFGRIPATFDAIHDALGEQAYGMLQANGSAASWQEIHDAVLDPGVANYT